MKVFTITLMFACFLFSKINGQNNRDTLTNKSIIQLKSAGLGAELIKSKISKSFCKFTLTTNDLIALKKAGISDEIVTAMLEKENNDISVEFQPAQPSLGTNSPQTYATQTSQRQASIINTGNLETLSAGIYYCKGRPCKLIEMDPSIYSQGKVGSGIGTALTYGLAKTKVKSTIGGRTANLQVAESQPEFHFFFAQGGTIQNKSGGMAQLFETASSPNEFMLVKFTATKQSREVVTGAAGIGGLATGVDEKNKIQFRYEKISQGVYRVYTEQPLKPGEYAFMYAGAMAADGGSALQKAYDFSVR